MVENLLFTRSWLPHVLILSAALGLGSPALAQGSDQAVVSPDGVTIVLEVKRVVVDALGKESFVQASVAKPGDILEYAATYTNRGKKSVRDVLVTLPIPASTVYEPNTAKPLGALASLGKDYETEPLLRKVRTKDGKEKTEPVPYAEYRSLRWRIATLDAGRAVTVAARVKVPATTEPQAAKP
jgi:uncharacterized repeat protein (TIGR01451 family)